MADDQLGQVVVEARDRVAGGRREREQRAHFAQAAIDRSDSLRPRHERARRPAEEPAHGPVAVRARNEDGLADPQARVAARLDHLAEGFVARNQRVAHPGEGRHLAGIKELFGAGGDARVIDPDHHVFGSRRVDRQRLETKLSGRVEQNRSRVHDRLPPSSLCRVIRSADASSIECQCSLTVLVVNHGLQHFSASVEDALRSQGRRAVTTEVTKRCRVGRTVMSANPAARRNAAWVAASRGLPVPMASV